MAELVGLNAQVPDILPKLSQMLQIQQQQTELAGSQQSLRQRQALVSYDWNKHIGDDGTFDLNSLSDPELRAAAGDQYLAVVTQAVQAKQQQLESKRTLTALRGEQREAFAELMGALRSDKDVAEDNEKGRQKVNQAMIQYGEMYGEDVLPVLSAYAAPLQKAPKGRMSDALRAIQLQAHSASQQLAAQAPAYTSTGSQLTQINPNAAAGAGAIPLSISPGAQAETAVDQLGNPYITYRDSRGNIIGTAPLGGGQGGPARFGPGERGTFEAQAEQNFKQVTANREAASMAPQQLDQINKALNLSKQVSTGSAASWRARVESGIGSLIPGFDGFDDATKLQELDKFAERIASDASRVLGVNATTDAQRESIHKQNANIGYTPGAIQAVLQYAKAQTMAMEGKGNAQEKWLKKEGNGITKQHEFETAFRQAYDPVIFQLEAADPDERKAIIDALDQKQAANLKEKRSKLKELGALGGG
jgi:hypothetical protein